MCDRILHTSFKYPFNYGYIPNTLADDGDPLDAVVICDYSLVPNCYITCKVLGVLITEDEKGMDEKIILVPIKKVDPKSKNITDIEDIPKSTINQIIHFFKHYKDLEEDKWINIGELKSKDKAISIIKETRLKYESK